MIRTGQAHPNPEAKAKRKHTSITSKISACIGDNRINGHLIKAAILEMGVSKYTVKEGSKEWKVLVPTRDVNQLGGSPECYWDAHYCDYYEWAWCLYVGKKHIEGGGEDTSQEGDSKPKIFR